VLRDAIIGALDILHLFDDGGRVVLIAGGEVCNIGSEQLRWIIAETFAEKHVIRKLPGLNYEVKLRPVQPSELAVRALLTKDPKDGGLAGLLPRLEVETQGFAAPVTAPEPKPIETNPVEHAAGLAAIARHASSAERTRLEVEQGRRVSERHRLGQQAAVQEAPAVEEYPALVEGQQPPPHARAEAKDSAVDPASPQA
jgi:hypothetical protein